MTAVIAAMDNEVELLKKAAKDAKVRTVAGVECLVCKINGKDVVVIKSGIGKAAAACATAIALSEFGADAVINTGLCAGTCGIGTIIVADKCVQHDFDATADGLTLGQVAGFDSPYFAADKRITQTMTRSLKNGGAAYVAGTIASGDRFVADREAMKNICEQFGAVGVEMESGAVAQICTTAGVPFAVLRCVSDGGDSVRDYYEFSRLACERFTAAVLDFLRET